MTASLNIYNMTAWTRRRMQYLKETDRAKASPRLIAVIERVMLTKPLPNWDQELGAEHAAAVRNGRAAARKRWDRVKARSAQS